MRITQVGQVDIGDRDGRSLGYVRPEFYQYATWFDDTQTGVAPIRTVTVPAGFVYILHAARAYLACDANAANRTLALTIGRAAGQNILVRTLGNITATQTGLIELGPVIAGPVTAADIVFYLKTDPPGFVIPAGSRYTFNVTNVQVGDVWLYAETVLMVPVP